MRSALVLLHSRVVGEMPSYSQSLRYFIGTCRSHIFFETSGLTSITSLKVPHFPGRTRASRHFGPKVDILGGGLKVLVTRVAAAYYYHTPIRSISQRWIHFSQMKARRMLFASINRSHETDRRCETSSSAVDVVSFHADPWSAIFNARTLVRLISSDCFSSCWMLLSRLSFLGLPHIHRSASPWLA